MTQIDRIECVVDALDERFGGTTVQHLVDALDGAVAQRCEHGRVVLVPGAKRVERAHDGHRGGVLEERELADRVDVHQEVLSSRRVVRPRGAPRPPARPCGRVAFVILMFFLLSTSVQS